MVVNYLSHAGPESWWEYESMGAGRVGTAHVDLFNGNLVVEYMYDAWGKPLSVTGSLKTSLWELNPFRYRGYVWDAENGLY